MSIKLYTGSTATINHTYPEKSVRFTGGVFPPFASQAEAQAGTETAKVMSPSTTFDAIEERAPEILSNPNQLINGDFQIWQRGTSSASQGGYFTADRWQVPTNANYTCTVSRSTDVPTGSHSQYSVSLNYTAVGAGDYYFRQVVENPARFNNATVTLSFWAKIPNGQTARFDVNDTIINETLTGTGAWVYYSYTGTFGGSLSNVYVDIGRAPSGTGEIFVTGVKLEFGSYATMFQPRTYAEELLLCKRYYQLIGGGSVGAYGTTTVPSFGVVFETEMRIAPTITLAAGTVTVEVPSIAIDTFTPSGISTVQTTKWSRANISGATARTAQNTVILRTDCFICNSELLMNITDISYTDETKTTLYCLIDGKHSCVPCVEGNTHYDYIVANNLLTDSDV